MNASSSSSIVFRFIPDSEGAKGATVSIPTNDLSCPSFSISLSGKGWTVALTTTAVSSVSQTAASSGVLGKGELVRATHQGLADELGSVREMVSRLLSNFQDHGWVALGREQIRITDAAALRRLANP